MLFYQSNCLFKYLTERIILKKRKIKIRYLKIRFNLTNKYKLKIINISNIQYWLVCKEMGTPIHSHPLPYAQRYMCKDTHC